MSTTIPASHPYEIYSHEASTSLGEASTINDPELSSYQRLLLTQAQVDATLAQAAATKAVADELARLRKE